MSRQGRRLAATVVFAVCAGLAWWLDRWEGGGDAARPEVAAAAGSEHNGYQHFPDCRLVPHRNNDGDSFVVGAGGDEITLRLYFVDTPEKELRDYNRKRIGYQSAYFGDIGLERAVEVGKEGKAFTLDLLETVPFSVFTRWEEVYDSGRYYGFVRLEGGEDSGRYLSEVLVGRGLARIYTKGNPTPDGRSRAAFEKHLKGIEAGARSAGQGGWGKR